MLFICSANNTKLKGLFHRNSTYFQSNYHVSVPCIVLIKKFTQFSVKRCIFHIHQELYWTMYSLTEWTFWQTQYINQWVYVFSSVQFSHSVVSDTLRPHGPQHARPPCPSPTPGVHSNSCPSSRWCHPAISSSIVPFSSCPQSLPASESFPMNQLFTWGGQSTGVSALASVLPMNTQDWSPLGWTGWISL